MWGRGLCWVLVLWRGSGCPFEFYNHLAEKERELVALHVLCCGCLCSVFISHGAMGWSAVCECGVFWSLTYSLTFHRICFHDKMAVVNLNICSRRISKLHFLDKNISRIKVKFKPVVRSSRD